jgi:hypothetical protein
VLIGVAILAVMMTLLASALFTFTRGARAGEARLDEIDSTHLVHGFLRRQLEGAYPLTERDDGVERVLFEGRAEQLTFVGHLPVAERGGLHFIDLAAGDQAGGGLTMRHREAWPETPFGTPGDDWAAHELLASVERVRFDYYGSPDDESPRRWTAEWLGHDRLPELIRLTIERAKDDVTVLVAEVRVQKAVAQVALFREPVERGR